MSRYFVIILILLFSIILPSAYADTKTEKFFPKYNALVEVDDSYERYLETGLDYNERLVYFENEAWHINGTDPLIPKTGNDTRDTYDHDILIGHLGDKTYSTFSVFNLDDLPKNTWDTKVTINSIQFQGLVNSVPHLAADKSYVTVYFCQNDTWYVKPANMLEEAIKIKKDVDLQYENETGTEIKNNTRLYDDELVRYNEMQNNEANLKLDGEIFEWIDYVTDTCYDTFEAADFQVVEHRDMPKLYSFDVTFNVEKAWTEKSGLVTFMTYGDPVEVEIPEGVFTPSKDLMYLMSYATINNPEYGIGKPASPLLLVTYTTEPTELKNWFDFMLTMALPTIATIAPVIIWIYRKSRKSSS